jgi:acetyltransferase-like isoleucine patch superfamily enzyme/glycosyltransferase involved in cell wall biosynthesis
MKPLLSICISTYNRCDNLRQTLESIVSQNIFHETDLIDVLILENHSSDQTLSMVTSYSSKYPGKITFFQPEGGMDPTDYRFINVLNRAKGSFLKLHNDNFLFLPGSLGYIIDLIKHFSEKMPVLFFLNQRTQGSGPEITIARSAEDFVNVASYHAGWISGFGIWRNLLGTYQDFGRRVNENIFIIDENLRLLESQRPAIMIYTKLFAETTVTGKGGYSLSQVWGYNYIGLLEELRNKGQISQNLLDMEKHAVLFNHILPYFYKTDYNFKKPGIFRELSKYWNEIYFQEFVDKLFLHVSSFSEIQATTKPLALDTSQNPAVSQEVTKQALWRSRNGHNSTELIFATSIDNISVGNFSYGPLRVHNWDNDNEELKIGNFVSIAESVDFMLGGEHRIDTPSSFPFRARFAGAIRNQAATKGPIIVEDDVWIGMGVRILSGVKLGKGSVIGAGSVVASSVEPYSIVVGNPARLVRYRFSREIIEVLLDVKYERLSREICLANIDIFEAPVSFQSATRLRDLSTNA